MPKKAKNEITSVQNPKIKNVIKLRNARERRKQNLVVIEGMRELSLAISAGIQVESLFMCEKLLKSDDRYRVDTSKINPDSIFEVSGDVFGKMALREESDGYIALAKPSRLDLEDVRLKKYPLVFVLVSGEKPGNLGAVLRTADASGADAVIVCDSQTDIYNPNVIRSSLGCIFTTQVIVCDGEQAVNWLKKKKIRIVAATPGAKKFYYDADLTGPCAIVMGSEAYGLSEKWLTESNAEVKIPMAGKIDSLNVSTSCAVLVFEVLRQRNSGGEGRG